MEKNGGYNMHYKRNIFLLLTIIFVPNYTFPMLRFISWLWSSEDKTSRPILYKAVYKGDEQRADLYITGTIHNFSPDLVHQRVYDALCQSCVVATEIGANYIKKSIEEEEKKSITDNEFKYRLHYASSIDLNFMYHALNNKKISLGLDAVDQHEKAGVCLKNFLAKNRLSSSVLLRYSATEPDLYRQGKDAYIVRMRDRFVCLEDEVYDIAVSARNKTWVLRLEDYSKKYKNDGPIFVAVGLSHLHGKDNLLDLLREKGFSIIRDDNHPSTKKAFLDPLGF